MGSTPDLAMKALAGQSVPMDRGVLLEFWRQGNVLEGIQRLRPVEQPPSLGLGPEGLITDLIEVGVLQRERGPEGRLNTPDVCRIHFGLGRKGGIKPVT